MISQKIRVLPSGALFQNLDLQKISPLQVDGVVNQTHRRSSLWFNSFNTYDGRSFVAASRGPSAVVELLVFLGRTKATDNRTRCQRRESAVNEQ